MSRMLMSLFVLASCTLNAGGPAPVTARPPPDPARMPGEVLDRQDPGADTSKHPVLTRTEAHYQDPHGPGEGVRQLLGCAKMFSCAATAPRDNDLSGLLIVAAALVASRRRRCRPRS